MLKLPNSLKEIKPRAAARWLIKRLAEKARQDFSEMCDSLFRWPSQLFARIYASAVVFGSMFETFQSLRDGPASAVGTFVGLLFVGAVFYLFVAFAYMVVTAIYNGFVAFCHGVIPALKAVIAFFWEVCAFVAYVWQCIASIPTGLANAYLGWCALSPMRRYQLAVGVIYLFPCGMGFRTFWPVAAQLSSKIPIFRDAYERDVGTFIICLFTTSLCGGIIFAFLRVGTDYLGSKVFSDRRADPPG